MFIGEYNHSLDQKGRLALPAKFRKQMRGAIITRGLDRCLFVFNKDEWDSLAKKLMELPLSQANSRAFVRLMLSGAMEAPVDSQGRILVPDYLRAYAGLKKQAVVTGLYNRVEIWDEIEWKKYKTKTEASSDEIAERMGELGI